MASNLSQMSMMPQMQQAFMGWTNKITLIRYAQTVTNGDVVITQSTYTFQGVIQPLRPKEIQLKPEAQWAFQWYQIHCVTGNLDLDVNDRITIGADTYKVMGTNNYNRNGYIEYHVIKDFAVST